MKCPEISEANKKIKNLKEHFRNFQISIEFFKHQHWDPNNLYIDKQAWENHQRGIIKSFSQMLKRYEIEIRNQRKLIKELNRKQNEIYRNL